MASHWGGVSSGGGGFFFRACAADRGAADSGMHIDASFLATEGGGGFLFEYLRKIPSRGAGRRVLVKQSPGGPGQNAKNSK